MHLYCACVCFVSEEKRKEAKKKKEGQSGLGRLTPLDGQSWLQTNLTDREQFESGLNSNSINVELELSLS